MNVMRPLWPGVVAPAGTAEKAMATAANARTRYIRDSFGRSLELRGGGRSTGPSLIGFKPIALHRRGGAAIPAVAPISDARDVIDRVALDAQDALGPERRGTYHL